MDVTTLDNKPLMEPEFDKIKITENNKNKTYRIQYITRVRFKKVLKLGLIQSHAYHVRRTDTT